MAFANAFVGERPESRRERARSAFNRLIDRQAAQSIARLSAAGDTPLPSRQAPQRDSARGRRRIRPVCESARTWQDFAGFEPSRRDLAVAPGLGREAEEASLCTMNKKTIAALASVGYPAPGSRQVNDEPKWWRLLQIIWASGGPNLQVFKRGLMVLSLFWRRLGILAGEIRAQVLVEIDRTPLAVRQGAATVMCVPAAAVAMPVISHRAAEQRGRRPQQKAPGRHPSARIRRP